MATAVKRIKSTKEYKGLLAVLEDDEKALAAYNRLHPQPAKVEADPIAQLVAHGFTEEQARLALAEEAATTAEESAPKPLTSKDRGKALVAERGLTFTKGRVYGGTTLAEAIVRVSRTGKPEIVASSGVGRTAGVLVYREESGDVALQNLTKPV